VFLDVLVAAFEAARATRATAPFGPPWLTREARCPSRLPSPIWMGTDGKPDLAFITDEALYVLFNIR
jgi:hypothetical protein